MPREIHRSRSLAVLLLGLLLTLCTAGAVHAAAHFDEGGSGHCAACRVVKSTPLEAVAVTAAAEPIELCYERPSIVVIAPAPRSIAATVARGPPAAELS